MIAVLLEWLGWRDSRCGCVPWGPYPDGPVPMPPIDGGA